MAGKPRTMRTESEWRRIITYAAKHGNDAAAEHYKVNSSLVYKWRAKLDGKTDGGHNKTRERIVASANAKRVNRLTDIITYANKALECVASRDGEGASLYLTHIRRAAQGKE